MSQIRILSTLGAKPGPLETVQVQELEEDTESSGDWITRLLSSGLFRHLTPENSHRFFAELEPVSVQAGQVVVEQGAPGEHFYVVTQGRCAVTRRGQSSSRELQLNVLKEGDAFGESALISGAPRTTTVRMLSNGVLMRLDRERFMQLVAAPTLSAVRFEEARQLIHQGAVWLDVRPHDQRTEHVFEGSLSAPIPVLGIKAAKLDPTQTYVVYCESGTHSSPGAFLLTRLGFSAFVLEDGLAGMRADADAAHKLEEVQPRGSQSRENSHERLELDETNGHPLQGLNETAQQARQGEDVTTEHCVKAGEAPADGPAVGELRAALTALTAERDRAIVAAARDSRRNTELLRLIGIERNKHQSVARQLEDACSEFECRIATQRRRFALKLRNVRRKLRDVRQEATQAVFRVEEEYTSQGNSLKAAEERIESVLETARSIERERSRLEQLLTDVGARLEDTTRDLAETKARLFESDVRLSTASTRLEDVHEQLTDTRTKFSESDARLSSTSEEFVRAIEQLAETKAKLAESDARLSSAGVELANTNGQLSETKARLAESDARLSSTSKMLEDANDRLMVTATALVEMNVQLSNAQPRLIEVEDQLSENRAQLTETDARLASTTSRLATVHGELATTQAKLEKALAEAGDAEAARLKAESALEVALAEMRGYIQGLATLRDELVNSGD